MVEPFGAADRGRVAVRARAARLTPQGTAGVASVAIAGQDAWPVIQPLFRTRQGQTLAKPPAAGSLRFGNFGPVPGDQVVLATPPDSEEPWYEVQCHGGMQVVEWILEQLRGRGADVVTWQQFLHGPRETIRSLAVDALTRATTLRTANILLDQSFGACERALRRVLELFDQKRVNAAVQALDRLLRWTALGRHLTHPWRVVIGGPVNAGKSSLINALAGFERAVVSADPGTTRDVVATSAVFDGWPVELIDTAGLRSTDAALEAEGIRRGRHAWESADLRIWLVDGSVAPSLPPADALLVINKIDLGCTWDPDQLATALLTSAKTRAGVDALIEAISRRLVPEAPTPGDAVPFASSLIDILEQSRTAIARGRAGVARGWIADLVQPS